MAPTTIKKPRIKCRKVTYNNTFTFSQISLKKSLTTRQLQEDHQLCTQCITLIKKHINA